MSYKTSSLRVETEGITVSILGATVIVILTLAVVLVLLPLAIRWWRLMQWQREQARADMAIRDPRLHETTDHPTREEVAREARAKRVVWHRRRAAEERIAEDAGVLEILLKSRRAESELAQREGRKDPHEPPPVPGDDDWHGGST